MMMFPAAVIVLAQAMTAPAMPPTDGHGHARFVRGRAGRMHGRRLGQG